MEKVVKVGDKEVKLKSTASLTYKYHRFFGRDLIKDIVKLQEKLDARMSKNEQFEALDLQMFSELAWTMAKTADDSIPNIEEWLDQFETFDIMKILPEVMQLLADNMRQEQPQKNV